MSEYVVNKTVTYPGSYASELTLPEGSFIVPIEDRYLPKHIYDYEPRQLYLDYGFTYSDDFKWCYTARGMLPILSELIRKIK